MILLKRDVKNYSDYFITTTEKQNEHLAKTNRDSNLLQTELDVVTFLG